jgi:hypothetical protein
LLVVVLCCCLFRGFFCRFASRRFLSKEPRLFLKPCLFLTVSQKRQPISSHSPPQLPYPGSPQKADARQLDKDICIFAAQRRTSDPSYNQYCRSRYPELCTGRNRSPNPDGCIYTAPSSAPHSMFPLDSS